MTIKFAGTEDISFTLIGAGGVVTTSTTYSTTYSRCSLSGSNNGTLPHYAGWQANMGATLTGEHFLVCRCLAQNTVSNALAIVFYSGLNPLVAVRNISNTIGIATYNGSTWTNQTAAGTASYLTNTLFKLKVSLNVAASGTMKIWSGDTLISDYSGDTRGGVAATGFDSIAFGGLASGSPNTFWSEVIVADEDCGAWRVNTHYGNASGDYSGWTVSGYSYIDEITEDVGDVIYSDTADQLFSMNLSDLPAGNNNVKAVIVDCHAQKGSSGPSQIAIGIRSSATDSLGSDTALGTSSTKVRRLMETNPITGVPFTRTEVNALQALFKSRT